MNHRSGSSSESSKSDPVSVSEAVTAPSAFLLDSPLYQRGLKIIELHVLGNIEDYNDKI